MHPIASMCREGKYTISSSTSAWPFMLEPAALTVQCLARSDAMARRLDENKVSAQNGAMCSCTALKRASKESVCAVFGTL